MKPQHIMSIYTGIYNYLLIQAVQNYCHGRPSISQTVSTLVSYTDFIALVLPDKQSVGDGETGLFWLDGLRHSSSSRKPYNNVF